MHRSFIDLYESRAPGFDWYVGQFFGGYATPSGAVAWPAKTFEIKGVQRDCQKNGDVSIATAAPEINSAGWVDRAFGGGGYFEMTIGFDPVNTVNAGSKRQWPAFWAMSV